VANYWLTRYSQALAQMETAQSADARDAYRDLAQHYLSMRRFCEGEWKASELLSAA